MIPVAVLERHPRVGSNQFYIADHYDVMAELDRDVHDNIGLAEAEVATALRLMGVVPKRVFLPCFGTGRHIGPLLEAGVERIVGVDLSRRCVKKARRLIGRDPRIELNIGDLTDWTTDESFDATILLGNSFGDIIDRERLLRVTRNMVAPIVPHGLFLMDYIGEGYLDRCQAGTTTHWQTTLNGRPVIDERTPSYDPETGIMTIHVRVTDVQTGKLVWHGSYQKVVLSPDEVNVHFQTAGLTIWPVGTATTVNHYYTGQEDELGMIARSTWYLGTRL